MYGDTWDVHGILPEPDGVLMIDTDLGVLSTWHTVSYTSV